MRLWWGCAFLWWGCAAPVPIERRDYALGQMAARWREFHPAAGDPDLTRDSELLSPRFGLPALAQADAPFELALLERNHPPPPVAQLCQGKSCWPVTLDDRRVARVADGVDEVRYHALDGAAGRLRSIDGVARRSAGACAARGVAPALPSPPRRARCAW